MSDQSSYDREFVGIVLADYWRTQIAPVLHAWKPYFDAVNDQEAQR